MSSGPVFVLIPALALSALSEWGGAASAQPPEPRRGPIPSVVARVLPAVVSITTRQIERDQFNQPVPTRGLGSGVIVDRQGHILTNSHVVAGAQEIKVTLPDERSYRARLVGADP
ncbi:MAG TPA: trypsin-like peptidase domain-containing protein, partial [Methylomirabilota bacterium]|nr:trypsin-like peptidase domain-containing protein [Methylomirabilota bacterium]